MQLYDLVERTGPTVRESRARPCPPAQWDTPRAKKVVSAIALPCAGVSVCIAPPVPVVAFAKKILLKNLTKISGRKSCSLFPLSSKITIVELSLMFDRALCDG